MRIGILTQPLHTNYGGLLQAYALQTTLKKMGHEGWIINRVFRHSYLIRRFASLAKRIIYRFILRRKNELYQPSEEEMNKVSKHTTRFVKSYISPITREIDNNKDLCQLTQQDFDAYIVGSDQVWRPVYSPCITNYFFDFAENQINIKRIAYAASFGISNWEFTPRQTKKCARLSKKFDAISVREDSGVVLCQEYLGVKAVHLLDPTMLLDFEDYIQLIEAEKEEKSFGNLMVYILDETEEKHKLVEQVAASLNLLPFKVMPKKKLTKENRKIIEDCVYPPVTRWLRGFMDAEFVITDSFHGSVFAIIFNKPFFSIGNTSRGMTRFTSLLRLYGLEDRLILAPKDLTLEKIYAKIDFERINRIHKEEQQKSISFLSKVLTR